VSCGTDDGALAVSLPVPAALRWVALVPEFSSSTAEARAVLPPTVPRADAVFNVQRVALLLAALQTGHMAALAAALDDRLHQPYRAALFPWMLPVMAAAQRSGALGCVLSGAGPSLLAVVTGNAGAVARGMEQALAETGLGGKASVLDVDAAGATVRAV
jgi:homoserine kinase